MALTAKEHRDLAQGLISIAHQAGLVILRHYAGDFDVERKADFSPVTEADREAEDVILEGLRDLAPGVPVIAEEQAAAGILPEIGSQFFLVDPLDGTKEFIRRNGEFTVNIALVHAGTPVFGLIFAPAFDTMYLTRGEGQAASAQIAARGAPPPLDEFKPLSTRKPDPEKLVGLTSRSHLTEAARAFLENHRVESMITSGSSLKFCMLAEGKADLYPRFGPTCEWDTAAGHAILAAAGGDVLTLGGAPFRYGKRESRFLNPGFVAWGRVPVTA